MALSDSAQAVVAKMQEKLAAAQAEARRWQLAINGVYESEGEAPPHDVVPTVAGAPTRRIRRYGPTEFMHRPLASVVRIILEDSGGATEDEIFDAMIQGGFDGFGVKDDDGARHALRTSLGKNVAFRRAPNGYYGLAKKRGPGRPRGTGVTEDGEVVDLDSAEGGTDGPQEGGEEASST